MISIIIMIVSLILDGILSNFLPYNDLSLFTPLLTVVSIFLIYPFYKKKEANYFITIVVLGIIYDLFYTNLLLFNAAMFFVVGYVTKIIYKNLEVSLIKQAIYLIVIIIVYELATSTTILIFNLVPITMSKVIYKITHSLLLNIIYGELIYIILKLIPKKYKKVNIN